MWRFENDPRLTPKNLECRAYVAIDSNEFHVETIATEQKG
jgi:hypothetical protein